MANTLTKITGFNSGVTSRSSGFTPVITKRFKCAVEAMSASAQIPALKLPEGSVLRYIIVDVKTVGTDVLNVGHHIGGPADDDIDTDPDAYGADIDLTTLGKTILLPKTSYDVVITDATDTDVDIPTPVLIGANHYVVVNPEAAEEDAEFEITAVVDVFDVDAYME